jgi:hypothetical protein
MEVKERALAVRQGAPGGAAHLREAAPYSSSASSTSVPSLKLVDSDWTQS